MPRFGWRWLLALSSLPSSLLLIFYKMTPESPRYLCLQDRKTEAVSVLEKIGKTNGRTLPSGILVSDHDSAEPHGKTHLLSPTRNQEQTLQGSFDSKVDSKAGGMSSLLMLFTPELLKPTLLLWVVFFGNAFAYYGLVLLTTELSNGQQICKSVKLQAEKSQDVNYKDVFITSFAEFPGLLIAAATVDRLGRKLSMSAMFFSCCIFLLPLAFHQPEGLTTILLFGARVCITGTFTVAYIYAPEVYPTSVRSTGVGVASSVGRIGGMLCPLVAIGLIQGCHRVAAIILFGAVSFLSGICILLFPFETKGRDLSDTVSGTKQIDPPKKKKQLPLQV